MKKVACIVVTYNRLALLKDCIESLRKQTNKDFDIIVVNNGSTDGTEEWLSQQTDIKPITQANVGGAGGFYTGMKTAFEGGYEWIWMMDDDGLAAPSQLENLLEGANNCNSKFVNALVCNVASPNVLAFGLASEGVSYATVNEAQKTVYIYDAINPFNGTLIHRDVIDKVGLIKKEMFIWGDEMEYTYRARKAGFKQYTITTALHYHPSIKSKQIRIIPFIGRFTVDVPTNRERAYIKYRNNGFLFHTYFPSREFKEKAKYAIYFISRLKFRELAEYFKYFNRGSRNIF